MSRSDERVALEALENLLMNPRTPPLRFHTLARRGPMQGILDLNSLRAFGLSLLIACLAAPFARAAAPIPPAVRTSPDADKQGPLIQDFVKEQATRIAGEDADARSKAREAIIDLVNPVNGQQPSAAFLDQVAQAVNTQLLPVASNQNMAVRLNAAIVAARVAEKADTARLAPLVQELLKDKSDPALIWALRAARYTLPASLRTGIAAQSKPLISAISAVGQAKTNSGPVIPEAYAALMLNFDDPSRNKNMTPALIGPVVPEVLKLMSLRTAMYATTAPPDPEADARGPFFLTNRTVWGTLSPAQRDQVMQQLYDLLNVAAQRVDLMAAGPVRDPYVNFIKISAKAGQVGAQQLGSAPLDAAFQAISQLNANQKIAPLMKPLGTALQSVLPNVKPTTMNVAPAPPPVDPLVPTTGPATAPTTAATTGPSLASTRPAPPPVGK